MDQARIFLAIALSFVVFLVWNLFFAPEPPEQQPEQIAQETPQAEEKAGAAKPYVTSQAEAQTEPPPPAEGPGVQTSARPARTITVSSPYYVAKISERQAAFRSFVLTKYREFVDPDSPLKQLVSEDNPSGTMIFGFQNRSVPGLEQAVYSAGSDDDEIRIGDKPVDLTFTWSSADGVVIEKKYHFSPDTYLIGLTVTIKNGSGLPIQDRPYLAINRILPQDKRAYGFTGPSALINNSLESSSEAAIEVSIKDRNDGIEIAVTDNGPGFPKQVLSHAFEPYTTTKKDGTGLGLVVCQRIVHDHGGTIEIANRTDGGSEVVIYLPQD